VVGRFGVWCVAEPTEGMTAALTCFLIAAASIDD